MVGVSPSIAQQKNEYMFFFFNSVGLKRKKSRMRFRIWHRRNGTFRNASKRQKANSNTMSRNDGVLWQNLIPSSSERHQVGEKCTGRMQNHLSQRPCSNQDVRYKDWEHLIHIEKSLILQTIWKGIQQRYDRRQVKKRGHSKTTQPRHLENRSCGRQKNQNHSKPTVLQEHPTNPYSKQI